MDTALQVISLLDAFFALFFAYKDRFDLATFLIAVGIYVRL